MKIRDIVALKEFDPVIDLSWAGNINEQERLLSNYIMTENLAETFIDILESLNLVRSKSRIDKKSGDIDGIGAKRAHIISGQYGTGKSYFLLMLSIILEMKNSQLTEELIKRFEKFPELNYQLKYIKDNKKYFVVRINGEAENEKEFKDIIQEQVIEALNEKFENIELTTIYIKVLEMFENIYSRNPDAIDKVLEKKNLDLDDIKAGLSNYKKHSLEQFEEIIEDAMGYKPKIEIENLENFLKNVNEVLKRNGYDELVIIMDEFSAYLTASMENRRVNKDLGQIQNLAQLTSVKSGINVSFISSTHKDLKEMLETGGNSNKDELDKVFGRFQPQILAFDQGEELLKNTIELDKKSFNIFKQKYNSLIDNLENKYKKNFEDFYPLHPSTVEYLEPISQLYAQKVRTTFGFLKEVVREKFFNKPIEENGKLNLITLSDLYDYFEIPIESKNPEIVTVYNQTYNYLNKDQELISFLKALSIAYASSLTKSSTEMELSSEELKDIYQLESSEYVRNKLLPIVANDYLNITTNDGKYRLFINNSGINIDKLINVEKDKINPYRMMLTILKGSENRIFIKNNNYEIRYNMGLYPMDRVLNEEIYSMENLENGNNDKIFNTEKDGKIIFLIPDFIEEYNQENILKKYTSILRDYPKNICLAVPHELIFNQNELKEYGAMLAVEKNNEEITKNEELKKLLVKRRRKLEDKIRNKYIRKFANLRNFTFIFGGGRVEDKLRQDIELYKEILYKYFDKFPYEIKVENFNTRSPLNETMQLFINGGIGEINKNDTSQASKIIMMALKPLDLVNIIEKFGKYSVEFKIPRKEISSISKEILDIIELEEEECSLLEKHKILSNAPYGLNLPLIGLYILVSNKMGRILITRIDNGKIVTLDKNTLDAISKKPEDYKILKNKIEEIPEEVGIVWKTLNDLRLINQSKAKDFRADGRNDFNPFTTIGTELRSIVSILKDREQRYQKKQAKTRKLKSLINKIEEATKKMNPKDLYNCVIDIPSIFKKGNFEDNIIEMKIFIEKMKKLKLQNLNDFEIVQDRILELRHVIKDLNGYRDLKELFKNIELENEKYKEDIFDIETLLDLTEKTTKLLNSYNHEFKKKHDEYHEKFSNLRSELLKNENAKIECLKSLKRFNFSEIASIDEFFNEVDNYQKCDVIIIENHITRCVACPYEELKKIETAIEGLEDKFKNYHRRILGIYNSYLEEIQTEKIKHKIGLEEDYIRLVINLNNVEDGNIKENTLSIIKEKVEKLSSIVNNITIDTGLRQEKSIEIYEITNKLSEEMESLGKNYVSLEELQNKFNKIIENYREKEYKLAKI